MILVDTNILIDWYHQSSPEIGGIFQSNEVALCGVVQAEFLRGTRTNAEVEWIKSLREVLHFVGVSDYDWEPIGFFLRTLREHGLAVPLADAIISYLAIKHNIEVWTRDRHFPQIQAIVPSLLLFDIDEMAHDD